MSQGVGVLAQLALLSGLWAAVGLGPAGWLAGAGYAACGWMLLAAARYRHGTRTWGPADRVTLARAVLTGGVTALVADDGGPAAHAALVALAAVALLLDAVDGQVARRTGTVTALGARFDMEVDALLILVLSVAVSRSLGVWVLAIGLMRYAFVAAAHAAPWLRAPLPPRAARKAVAAAQGIVLVTAAAGVLPAPAAAVTVAGALVLLTWSFGRDVRWLHRASRVRPSPASPPSGRSAGSPAAGAG
ncbi:CDP-alcohol phosphatidyltransferase-like enzyme [Prauserella muralis]|nr:CDP-alcohol phosphatidyltransferase-like enzyme [Prauserella muralis]